MQKAYATIASLIAVAQYRLKSEEKGATAVEYGLMVGLIAVVIIVAVTALGGQLKEMFTSITNELKPKAAAG
jgi:pilus assembly protein Flp/PilA